MSKSTPRWFEGTDSTRILRTGDDDEDRFAEGRADAAAWLRAEKLYESVRQHAIIPRPPWEDLRTTERVFWREVSEAGILERDR